MVVGKMGRGRGRSRTVKRLGRRSERCWALNELGRALRRAGRVERVVARRWLAREALDHGVRQGRPSERAGRFGHGSHVGQKRPIVLAAVDLASDNEPLDR